MTDTHLVSRNVDTAEAAARIVLRLLSAGNTEVVWKMLHVDYRAEIVGEFMATPYGPELLTSYGRRLHRAQFRNLATERLLNLLAPLPDAAAAGLARTIDLFAADESVVVTFEVDGQPGRRWNVEMTWAAGCWRWHHLATV